MHQCERSASGEPGQTRRPKSGFAAHPPKTGPQNGPPEVRSQWPLGDETFRRLTAPQRATQGVPVILNYK